MQRMGPRSETLVGKGGLRNHKDGYSTRVEGARVWGRDSEGSS